MRDGSVDAVLSHFSNILKIRLSACRSFRKLRKRGLAKPEKPRDALVEGNYPYTVRLSQECVELSLKAVLKAVGIEYPKIHDVQTFS
jgi:HEPN domain-containing protein